MQKQQAEEAEIALRELITATRGYSAYQDLLKIRRDTLRERKEQERREAREAEERQEMIIMIGLGITGMILAISLFAYVGKRIGIL